jgi:MacB-like periplasmic core domain
VGANTAAFSVADFVLLRPLSFPDSEALVRLCEGPRRGGGWGCMNQLSPANYRDFKRMSSSFEEIGAFASDAVNLVGGGEPRRLAITPITPEVLPLLGVRPVLGRVFESDSRDETSAAVISYGLWQSQFGGSAGVLGRKVNLDGARYTIIGVMPPAFYFPSREVPLWTLLTFREEDFANRNNSYIEAVGRLRHGVAFEQARAELSMLADRLGRDYPETNAETGVSVFRMRDNMSRSEFYERVLSGVRALPGVQSAAFISGLPMVVTGLITGIEIPGQDLRSARSDGVSHRWVRAESGVERQAPPPHVCRAPPRTRAVSPTGSGGRTDSRPGCRPWRRPVATRASSPRENLRRSPAGTASTSGRRSDRTDP